MTIELGDDGLEDLGVGLVLDEVGVGPGEALDRCLVTLVLERIWPDCARARNAARS